MGRALVLLFIFCVTVNGIAQSYGLIENETTTIPIYQFENSKGGNFKESISLKKYCPRPGDQGKINSCSSWASCYGAQSILSNISKGYDTRTTATNNSYLPLSIHNEITANEDQCNKVSGTNIEDVLNYLKNTGSVCKSEVNDSKISFNCSDNFSEYYRTKIEDFALVFTLKDSLRKISNTKSLLNKNIPVIIGFNVYKSFEYSPPGILCWSKTPNDIYLGAHAMVVIGYDELDKTFEIMNSRGPQWANRGFIKVKYNDFAAFTTYGYAILNNTKELIKNEYKESDKINIIDFYTDTGVLTNTNDKNQIKKFRIKIQNIQKPCTIYGIENGQISLISKLDETTISNYLPFEVDDAFAYKLNAKPKLIIDYSLESDEVIVQKFKTQTARPLSSFTNFIDRSQAIDGIIIIEL